MKRLLPFIVLIAMILGLAIAIPMILRPERYRPALEQTLTRHIGRPTFVSKLGIGLLPPALTLGGVRIEGPDPKSPPLLEAETVQVQLAWAPLFKAKIVPEKIRADRWSVRMRRLPNGSWEWRPWEMWVAPASAAAGPSVTWTLQHGEIRWSDDWASSPWQLDWQELQGTRKNGTLVLEGQWLGEQETIQVHAESTAASTALTFKQGERELKVKADFAGGRLTGARAESAQWRWDVLWPVIQRAARVGGRVLPATDSPLVKNWISEFRVEGSTVVFSQSGNLAGGATESRGTIRRQGGETILKFTSALKDVPVAALPDVGGLSDTWSGLFSGLADAELSVSSTTRRARGPVTFEVRNGFYRFPASTVRSVRKARTLAYLRKKYPDFEGKGLAFSSLRVDGKADGVFFSLDTARVVVSPDITVTLTGSCDLARSGFDGWAKLDIREKDKSLRRLLPGRYWTGAPGKETMRPIFGRLQGIPTEWYAASAPAAKVPAAARKHLR